MSVQVTPIARSLGATVTGVDLRDRLSDDDFAVIYDALMQHLVLFFRDQDLDDVSSRPFAGRDSHRQYARDAGGDVGALLMSSGCVGTGQP